MTRSLFWIQGSYYSYFQLGYSMNINFLIDQYFY
jgi:hypothetical protein